MGDAAAGTLLGMGAQVFLHVGAPKTGTTYLQDRLFLNRTSLSRHGIKYPTGLREDMFLAAVDLTGIKWPGFVGMAHGEWDALVRRTKISGGTVVLSHEILAVAKPSRIRRVAEDLGGPDTELHVVFTARDIARQLTADWQEGLKMYGTKTFAGYLRETIEGDPRISKQWFWRAQHLRACSATGERSSHLSASTSSCCRIRAATCGRCSPE